MPPLFLLPFVCGCKNATVIQDNGRDVLPLLKKKLRTRTYIQAGLGIDTSHVLYYHCFFPKIIYDQDIGISSFWFLNHIQIKGLGELSRQTAEGHCQRGTLSTWILWALCACKYGVHA